MTVCQLLLTCCWYNSGQICVKFPMSWFIHLCNQGGEDKLDSNKMLSRGGKHSWKGRVYQLCSWPPARKWMVSCTVLYRQAQTDGFSWHCQLVRCSQLQPERPPFVLLYLQFFLSTALQGPMAVAPVCIDKPPQSLLWRQLKVRAIFPIWTVFGLSEWGGRRRENVSHIDVSSRASCCFVHPTAETVCTLLVHITSTFLVPPRNHLLRS